ncbi:hypothetical protein E3N88_33363 [Mikania micrantha]|uniref:Uncharacterized protein n=1 Tax=Mikania micrantha TaxID=192012 RepID=A0A5N6MBM9_9ASTR|nr:hypothetical protein E3N88_33363 [Mikania micrantha]
MEIQLTAEPSPPSLLFLSAENKTAPTLFPSFYSLQIQPPSSTLSFLVTASTEAESQQQWKGGSHQQPAREPPASAPFC